MNPRSPFVSVFHPSLPTHPRSISLITHVSLRCSVAGTDDAPRTKNVDGEGQGKRADLPVADSEEDIAAV